MIHLKGAAMVDLIVRAAGEENLLVGIPVMRKYVQVL